MGDPDQKVLAPKNSGVMFVEINYRYVPVTGTWLLGSQQLRSVASFIVRDRRTFALVSNPSPTAKRSTCDLYTS